MFRFQKKLLNNSEHKNWQNCNNKPLFLHFYILFVLDYSLQTNERDQILS